MTTPNLTAQADVAIDPMAGTLQTGRIAYSPDFQSEQRNIHGSIQAADTYARAPDPWARGGAEAAPDASPRRADAGSTVVPEPGVNVCILALDLGTKLGWAVRARDGRIVHGTEAFTPRKSWTPGQRWLRARSFLTDVIVRHQVHAIAYEDVKRHAGTDAAHAYGAFLCLVQMVADSHRTALLPVGVGTIKKHWTGKGNADKDAMKAQAKVRGFSVVDDNDADALAILHWAVAQERAA
ncbi:hypothetical protein [Achromobacter spanius]|uniref:Uncharacterized protein n=1 Tax=Achromobacter spanius TaxID=217203 RepID=A0AAW3I618_9BURK|nr:hypothetical protein [Achromobacter spanius]KNE28199.1 hypothetical protein AFM18_08535 [Achromobacter spanius]